VNTTNTSKDERRRILDMLSEGKISAHDAGSLLDAISAQPSAVAGARSPAASPKYLRVLVEGQDGSPSNKVNVRVPLDLIRAGMRLAALLPAVAYEPVNRALKQNGVDLDVSKIKPENLEALVEHLRELSVDVESAGEKVRVFCE
jgi:hypothetical protein